MILGYESPVDITPMSIYDKDMMKMYIGALLKDYERGLEDSKDFINNFGNFTSPLVKDIENWNDVTTKPMSKLLLIPDLIRSLQGRAALALFVATRPYGDMSMMRQSAKNAELYLLTIRELKMKGLYNQDYEDFINKGFNLNNWSTSSNGVWTNTSANEFKNLNSATSGWFDDLKDSYIRSDGKYDYTGVNEEQMNPIIDSYINGFINSDLGKYYLNTLNGDVERLKKQIITANKERIHETRSVNVDYQLKLEERLKRIDHEYRMLESDHESNNRIREHMILHPEEYNADGTKKSESGDDGSSFSAVTAIYYGAIGDGILGGIGHDALMQNAISGSSTGNYGNLNEYDLIVNQNKNLALLFKDKISGPMNMLYGIRNASSCDLSYSDNIINKLFRLQTAEDGKIIINSPKLYDRTHTLMWVGDKFRMDKNSEKYGWKLRRYVADRNPEGWDVEDLKKVSYFKHTGKGLIFYDNDSKVKFLLRVNGYDKNDKPCGEYYIDSGITSMTGNGSIRNSNSVVNLTDMNLLTNFAGVQ